MARVARGWAAYACLAWLVGVVISCLAGIGCRAFAWIYGLSCLLHVGDYLIWSGVWFLIAMVGTVFLWQVVYDKRGPLPVTGGNIDLSGRPILYCIYVIVIVFVVLVSLYAGVVGPGHFPPAVAAQPPVDGSEGRKKTENGDDEAQKGLKDESK